MKINILKPIIIGFMGAVATTIFMGKIDSIILSTDIASYILFISSSIALTLLTYKRNEVKQIAKNFRKQRGDKKKLPQTLYEISKAYTLNDEETIYQILKKGARNKTYKKFISKFLDKSTLEEIKEFLSNERKMQKESEAIADKFLRTNLLITAVSALICFTYDYNIKGILLVSMLSVCLNMLAYTRIVRFKKNEEELINLFEEIHEDIYNFKNPKYIMYKTKSLLGLEEYEILERAETEVIIENNNKKKKVSKEENNPRSSKKFTVGIKIPSVFSSKEKEYINNIKNQLDDQYLDLAEENMKQNTKEKTSNQSPRSSKEHIVTSSHREKRNHAKL